MKGRLKHHRYNGKLDREMETRSMEDAVGSFCLREAVKERELNVSTGRNR